MKPILVTIDGGAGTGTSSLATNTRDLLQAQGVKAVRINSGSLYRAIAYMYLQLMSPATGRKRLSLDKLLKLMREYQLGLVDGQAAIFGIPIPMELLKTSGINHFSSQFAIDQIVRDLVNEKIREYINQFDGVVLLDGRSGGRTEFPNARIKKFLTARPETAAARTPMTVFEIMERDKLDRSRQLAPMLPAEDADIWPTDDYTEEQLAQRLAEEILAILPRR